MRKLGHKVRVSEGPAEVACTNFYVNADEWILLLALPALTVQKKRQMGLRDGGTVAGDEHDYRTLIADIDDRDQPSTDVPTGLDIVEDVSENERWTGAALARRGRTVRPPDRHHHSRLAGEGATSTSS